MRGRNAIPASFVVMRNEEIQRILQERAGEIMGLPGVVGVGEGLSGQDPCIVVMVSESSPELAEALPTQLESFPVVLRVTGEFRARE